MKNSISVLIPCYNCRCRELVSSLHLLLEKEKNADSTFRYEVIVADDGSTCHDIINYNKSINNLPNCRYITRGCNVGRAAIRNFLAKEASLENFLFLDGDITITDNSFISKYRQTSADVVVGGLAIGGDSRKLNRNIRFLYEKAAENAHNADSRKKSEHKEFRTTNFMISRRLALRFPFNENFKGYGYEDVLMGKELSGNNIRIEHIDNPVVLDDYEDNETFIAKTEEAMRTLKEFENELQGYSTLLTYYEKIKKWHLATCVRMIHSIFGKSIRKNLAGNNPQLFLFNLYKLIYFTSLS